MNKNISIILLAAGRSSRFWPLNYKHKSLFKLMGKSIIEHLIEELSKQNFKEIIIVSSPHDEEEIKKIVEKLENIDIKVTIQREPRGMWDAIIRGVDASSTDKYIVLNAHKLNVSEIADKLIRLSNETVALTVTETENPEIYGIVKVSNDRVVDVVEKPPREKAPSNLRIIGVYLFSRSFVDFMAEVAEEEESEYKLEYSLSLYARKKGIRYIKVGYEPLSIRFPWDVFKYMKFMFNRLNKKFIHENAEVSKWSIIEGPVIIEEGAKVSRHATIIGPAYIGKNAFVGDYSIVRGSNLEAGSVVGAHFEMARSILQEESTTHSGYMGDSIVGEKTRIGAGFISANVRLDRATVKCYVKGEKIDTGMRKLGVIIGKNTALGIHVGTMPGVFIGSNVIIGPGKMVYRNVPDGEKIL